MHQPDEVCLGDLGVTYQERMARLQEVMQRLASLRPEVMEHLGVITFFRTIFPAKPLQSENEAESSPLSVHPPREDYPP
jgi:hypothetical protein